MLIQERANVVLWNLRNRADTMLQWMTMRRNMEKKKTVSDPEVLP